MSYDTSGNLLNVNGYALGWTGRRLTSATNAADENSLSFTYNQDGIRTSKTVNGTTTYYYKVDESNNVVEQYRMVAGSNFKYDYIRIAYDSNGSPVYFTFNRNGRATFIYYYEKNLQGDIVGLLDENGDSVVQYAYDEWGKVISVTGTLAESIGRINPLRYRGYYYDNETGLYYLQSRYYDPAQMRFISQDDPASSNAQGQPLGSNLYAYCLNNPVMKVDPTGKIALVDDALCLVFIALCVVVMGVVLTYMTTTPEFQRSWSDFCNAAHNGLSSIGTTISNGGKAVWKWTKATVKAAIAALSTYYTIAKADAKIRTKVKRNSKQRYWVATIKNASDNTYVEISSAISYSKAKERVASGLCVFTVSKSEARQLASKFPPVVGPDIGSKSIGQYKHYHVRGRKSKAHIFFLI